MAQHTELSTPPDLEVIFRYAVKWRIYPLKINFLQEISEHGIFHGIVNMLLCNCLKINRNMLSFTIEWE